MLTSEVAWFDKEAFLRAMIQQCAYFLRLFPEKQVMYVPDEVRAAHVFRPWLAMGQVFLCRDMRDDLFQVVTKRRILFGQISMLRFDNIGRACLVAFDQVAVIAVYKSK